MTLIARQNMHGTRYEFAAFTDHNLNHEATEADLTPYPREWRGAAAKRVYLAFRLHSGMEWERYPLPHYPSTPFAVSFCRRFDDAELISPALQAVAHTLARLEAERQAKEDAEQAEQVKMQSARYALQLHVEALIPQLHGKKRELLIPTSGDSVTVTATCYGVRATGHFGVWAIHTMLGHVKGIYTVTHCGTGLALKKELSLSEARFIVARLLDEAPEWREGIPKDDSPAKLRALCIARAPYVPAELILSKAA